MRVTNPPQCIRCLSHSLGLSLLRSQANGPSAAMAVDDADGGASGEGGVAGMGLPENVPSSQVSALEEHPLPPNTSMPSLTLPLAFTGEWLC